MSSVARWLLSTLALGVACSVDDLPTDQTTNPGFGGSAGATNGGTGATGSGATGGSAGVGGLVAGGGGTGGADSSVDSGTDSDADAGCTIVYVSPSGNDAESGCQKEAPKKTITSAVAFAKSSSEVAEIHVCAGVFEETLTFDVGVDLKGGYGCSDWKRTTGYGYPTFDAVNETVLGGGTQPKQAVLVTGAVVSASVAIDGLTIHGPKGPSVFPGVALRIEEDATPVVSNCRILGGDTFNTSGDGSVGISVESDAKPEIHSNHIDGGTGGTQVTGATYSESGVGRVGVVVDGTSAYLHDNYITGGKQTPPSSNGIPSAAIVLRGAPDLTEAQGSPILRNEIVGGDGNGAVPGIASAGILAFGASDFDLVESEVRPGKCLNQAAVQLRGVHSEATGDIRVLRSRIYGGDLSNENDTGAGFRVGAWIENANSFLAENDMIYGGVAKQGFAGQSPNFALALSNVIGPVVRHSTLYSGPSGFPTVGTALKVYFSVTKLLVQNNILAVDAGWNEAFYVEPCASLGVFERVENNLLFNFGDPSLDLQVFGYGPDPQGSACGPWQGIATVDEMTAHLLAACTASGAGCASFGGVKVSGNRTLRQNCGADSSCIPWNACGNESSPCLQSVFQNWSLADNGLTTLFGPGWKLDAIPCAITQSSLNLGVTTDLFGALRTGSPSMGAHEQDGACQ